MSDNWQTAGTIKSDKEQRGRLRSTAMMNAIKERVDYLKEVDREDEANCLRIQHEPLVTFIRDEIDSDVFDSGVIMRKTSRDWVDQFVAFAEKSDDPLIKLILDGNGKLEPKMMESVVDIFFTLAHIMHMNDLEREHTKDVAKLVDQLNRAKSVFTVRQALEQVAGAPPPKDGAEPETKEYFWHKFGRDTRLQQIFNNHFGHIKWQDRPIRFKPFYDKAVIAHQLFSECYAHSSDEIHFRPNSAPEIGGTIIANKMSFRPLQQVFLQVIAEYLDRGNVVWLE